MPVGEAGIEGAVSAIDPVLFLGSALFIVGMAILFLRVFPLLVRLLFIAGKEFWKPGMYASIIGLTRSGGQEQFIILFMTLTVAIGFFSTNSARTINRNMQDRIRHQTGADIRLFVRSSGNDGEVFPDGLTDELPGIAATTKVFDSREIYPQGISVQSGSTTVPGITLMGIVPHEFVKVAWYRNGLLPHHLSDYLILLQHSPKAVLVSSVFRNTWKYGKGDLIYIPNGANDYIEGVIYDFVDYWPGIADPGKGFVVANLSYLQDMGLDKPVQVWLKEEAGAQDTPIFEKLNDKLLLEKQEYADDLIRKAKNDSKLQGTNGILTLSFIITILISMIGFSIYCVLSVKRRVLQFGIQRAMGLSRVDVASMRTEMGFVFQSVALLSMLTAYENVEFGLPMASVPKKGRRARAEECLKIVGLGARMDHRPHEMSGGEQQRTTIARAIAHRPKILFADEPTAELDTHLSILVVKLFRELVDK